MSDNNTQDSTEERKDDALNQQKSAEKAAENLEVDVETVEEPVKFTLNKNKYQFKVPVFRFKGNKITSTEAKENKELLKLLVDTNSFVIEKL